MSNLRNFLDDYQEWLLNDYGFFKPYKDFKDFKYTVISPIVAPVVYVFTSCICFSLSLVCAVLAVPIGVGAALLGPLFNNPELGKNVMDSMFSGAGSLFVSSLSYLGIALLSIVGAPIGLVTRTIATLIDGLIKLCGSGTEDTKELALSPI